MGISTYWTDTYAVGNELIDRQHKKLLEISGSASKLLSASRVAAADFQALLNDFVETLREHFDAEEKALASNGYPDLAKQAAEHDAFRLTLANLVRDADNGQLHKIVLLVLIADYADRHLYADVLGKHYLMTH